MRNRFPPAARLTRQREFTDVYRSGRALVIAPLHMRALERAELRREGDACPGVRSRLGLSVGRKIGNAVVRNRWKRAIREAFRRHRHCLPAPYDVVVGVAWNSTQDDLRKVEGAFLALAAALRRSRGDAPEGTEGRADG